MPKFNPVGFGSSSHTHHLYRRRCVYVCVVFMHCVWLENACGNYFEGFTWIVHSCMYCIRYRSSVRNLRKNKLNRRANIQTLAYPPHACERKYNHKMQINNFKITIIFNFSWCLLYAHVCARVCVGCVVCVCLRYCGRHVLATSALFTIYKWNWL